MLKQLQNLREGHAAGDVASGTCSRACSCTWPKPFRAESQHRLSADDSIAPLQPANGILERACSACSESVSDPAMGNSETLWNSLLEAVGRASPFTQSYLLEAHPVSFS